MSELNPEEELVAFLKREIKLNLQWTKDRSPLAVARALEELAFEYRLDSPESEPVNPQG